MPSTLHAKRLFVESVPVAEILLLWSVPAVLVQEATLALRGAGISIALTYLLARADAEAAARARTAWPRTGSEHVRENWRLLVAAGPWLLAALVTQELGLIGPFGPPGLFDQLIDALWFAFTGAAVGVALLYALAFGLAWVRRDEENRGGSVGAEDDPADAGSAATGD